MILQLEEFVKEINLTTNKPWCDLNWKISLGSRCDVWSPNQIFLLNHFFVNMCVCNSVKTLFTKCFDDTFAFIYKIGGLMDLADYIFVSKEVAQSLGYCEMKLAVNELVENCRQG